MRSSISQSITVKIFECDILQNKIDTLKNIVRRYKVEINFLRETDETKTLIIDTQKQQLDELQAMLKPRPEPKQPPIKKEKEWQT